MELKKLDTRQIIYTLTIMKTVTIKTSIRKVTRREAYKISVEVIKADGSRHDSSSIVNGSRSKAKGRLAMLLRNFSQSADLVIINL